jgi:hypothetical protein
MLLGKSGPASGGPFTTTGHLGMPRVWASSPFNGTAGNRMYLQGFINHLDAACTFSTYTVSFNSSPTAGTKWTPALYSDSSGAPGTLIASGTEITATGSEGANDVTYSFGSTQTLSANTTYWFGFLMTAAMNIMEAGPASTNSLLDTRWVSQTYGSGPPSSPTGFSATGNIYAFLLNVTAARGVAGFWDLFNQIGGDWITASGEADTLKITTPASGTCNADGVAVRLSWNVVNGSKFKGVIYADSSGSPGALVATGSEITVATADANKILESTFSGVTLSASTTYWVGIWSNDANRLMGGHSGSGYSQYKGGGTYASGPFSSMSGSSDAGRELPFYLLFS